MCVCVCVCVCVSTQLLDTASLSVMSTVDLNRSPDGTITSVQYNPDKEGGTQNVALVARVGCGTHTHTYKRARAQGGQHRQGGLRHTHTHTHTYTHDRSFYTTLE